MQDPLRRSARRWLDVALAWAHWARHRPPHRVLVMSVPKSGTNLARSALGAFDGLQLAHTGFRGRNLPPAAPGTPAVPMGVDWPAQVDALAVRRRLRTVPPGGVAQAHVGWSSSFAELLDRYDYRAVVMLRDPRDVATSLVPYLLRLPHHFLHDRFAALPEQDRYTAALEGLPPGRDGLGLLDMATRFRSVARWSRDPRTIVVRFEDLVGERGGGDRDTQLRTLAGMRAHVGLAPDEDQVARVADDLFGSSRTFRKGQIGTWREQFSDEQVELSRRLLGDLLIEWGYEADHDWSR